MASGKIQVAALQIRVSMDVRRNVAVIDDLLGKLPRGTVAVAPEGALSGYLPEADFVTGIDQDATWQAIERLAHLCRSRDIHLIAGACVREGGAWLNSSFCFSPDGGRVRYDKVNLAQSERGTFTAGNTLPVFDICANGIALRIGIQMCREIRYPEQWRVLAHQGAQLIAYVNNAVGGEDGDLVWRAHMMSRAAELQRFVIGANNAAADQKCPTLIVAPSGLPVAELPAGREGAATATISPAAVSDWVLSQSRDDVVRVALNDGSNGDRTP